MKAFYSIVLGLFIITSCGSPEQNVDNNKTTQETKTDTTAQTEEDGNDMQSQLANEWVLIQRKSIQKDTTVEFSVTPPAIITQFKISGFFSVSDLINIDSDQGKTQKLEARSSGQWELHDDQLKMRFGTGDSTSLSIYTINKVSKDSLFLTNDKNGIVNIYTKRK